MGDRNKARRIAIHGICPFNDDERLVYKQRGNSALATQMPGGTLAFVVSLEML